MNGIDLAPAEAFTYARTLERGLVNRRSVAEVFLTDFHAVSEREWIVGAQLPVGHAYFADHIEEPRQYDLLLLLECCRQAGTYGGYLQFGSPPDTVNVVSSLRLSISDTGLLRVGSVPGRLVIHVEAVDVVGSASNTKRVTPRMTLFLDGRPLGDASIPVRLASPELFRALRARARTGPAVLTSELVPPDAEPVPPSSVGRALPVNVLLAGAQLRGRCAEAVLSLRPENRSILDHEYDHIPAMALVDAAVQLMTWHTGRSRSMLSALRAEFDRFAEVDGFVDLRGEPGEGDDDYQVRLRQAGVETGAIAMRFGA